MPSRRTLVAATAALAAVFARPGLAQETPPAGQVFIPGPAGRLRLLHRPPASGARRGAPVLMVHPFSPGTALAFDAPGGLSWMAHLAAGGRDTWALDLRGFGESGRPAPMQGPPEAAPPAVRAPEAAQDVAAACEHVLAATGAERLDLVGWSFGSVLAAMHAITRPGQVRRLVLLGAMHGFDLPFMAELFEVPGRPGVLRPDLPAYRVVTPEFALAHWALMRRDLPADTVDPATVRAVEAVAQASDPGSAPRLRQPMGPLVDLHAIWRDHPIYDAGRIHAPVLLVRGDHDLFADPGLAGKLTGAAGVREVVIPGATHWVPFERRRGALLDAADGFLDVPA